MIFSAMRCILMIQRSVWIWMRADSRCEKMLIFHLVHGKYACGLNIQKDMKAAILKSHGILMEI